MGETFRFAESDKRMYRHNLAQVTKGRLDYLLDLTLFEMEFLRLAFDNLIKAVIKRDAAEAEASDG